MSIAREQVDYHLAGSQAAAASRMPGAKTALQPAVEGLACVLRRVHAERQIELSIQPIPQSLSFRG